MRVANHISHFAFTLMLTTGLASCLQQGIYWNAAAEADSSGDTDTPGLGGNGGGTTGTGVQVCVPLSQVPCYGGPAATEGIGVCKGGVKTCLADGSAFGPCTGQTVPTSDNCASAADEDCNGVVEACVGSAVWAAAYGDASDQWGSSIATDPDGNIAIFGMFGGIIDFGITPPPTGSGSLDIFLTKLSSTGSTAWSKSFVSSGVQGYLGQVAFDSAGNVYVTGSFSSGTDFGNGEVEPLGDSDVFLIKLDSAGNILWSRSFGDSGYQYAFALAVTPVGVAITGTFSGTMYFDGLLLASTGGLQDIFLAHLNADGDVQFCSRFGEDGNQFGRGLAVDPDGNLLLGAEVNGGVQFGSTMLVSSGQRDIAIAKFDLGGMHLWSKLIGNGSEQEVKSVAVDGGGNVIVTGTSPGTVDFGGGPLSPPGDYGFYVLKLDPSGDHLWTQMYGSDDFIPVVFAATDVYDNVLVTGSFRGNLNLGGPTLSAAWSDIFALKLASDGSHVWSKRYGDSMLPYSSQGGHAVAADPAGNVLLTGYFKGTVDFGNGELSADPSTTSDVFVAKLSP